MTLWAGCATAVALAGVAGFADRKRNRRTDPDAVGFMPWPLIMILSLIGAATLAAFALKLH